MTLAPANQVVKGSDPTKLKYKQTNIQVEYEMIKSEKLSQEASRVYNSGKTFLYDHVILVKNVTIKRDTDTNINVKVNSQ